MALSLAETVKPPSFNALVGENYQRILNQSMEDLLAEIEGGSQNFSRFIDIFSQLMQAEIDPPLESIWVYSTLLFHSHKSAGEGPRHRLAMVKKLFQLVSWCSASCSSMKSIVLLAPVIFELYKLVVELFRKDLSSKKEKKALRGASSLIDSMLGYIGLCSSKKSHDESACGHFNLNMPIVDLVRVWTEGQSGFECFFPLISSEVIRKMEEEEIDLNRLAGAVVAETFFLKILSDINHGIEVTESENELRKRAVGSFTGFQSIYFFEILVNMFLEPELPLASLLNSEDVPFVKKVLWDAVILVEYSFLNSESSTNQPTEQMRRLALTRLILTHEAIEFCRESGDHKRAVSYSSAFSISSLRSQIIRWISVGLEAPPTRPNGSSTKAIIQWLLGLERQGINVFEDSLLKRRARLATDNSKGSYSLPSSKAEEQTVDDGLLFYIDDKGEKGEEENEEKRVHDLFISAARSMKLSGAEGKKRKARGSARKKKSIKYIKYDLSSAPDSVKNTKGVGGSSSGSEIEDPQSDDE